MQNDNFITSTKIEKSYFHIRPLYLKEGYLFHYLALKKLIKLYLWLDISMDKVFFLCDVH